MLYNFTHASSGIILLSSAVTRDRYRDLFETLLKVILQYTIHVLLILKRNQIDTDESIVIMQLEYEATVKTILLNLW